MRTGRRQRRSAASGRSVGAEPAAAARQRFPRLTLSAALGLLSFDLSSLFESDALVGSLGAGLAAPLFDFGRIEAEIDGAAAGKKAAFAAYRGAVFGALGEVESAYGLVAGSDAQVEAAAREFAELERAAALAETRLSGSPRGAPAPDQPIAAEIIEDLEAALDEFAQIAADLRAR